MLWCRAGLRTRPFLFFFLVGIQYSFCMSPTVLRVAGFRFFFFSREEQRIHVHVSTTSGEAKFWLEPAVQIAQNHGLSMIELNQACKIIEDHYDEICSTWHKHFGS